MQLDQVNFERAILFYENYEIEYMVDLKSVNKKTYVNDTSRKCRFCGLSIPDTTFSSIPHTIPRLLGNRHLVSNFECDNCNKLFKNYEDSLSNYLGMYRTITLTKGKSKTPKFKQNQSGSGLEVFEKEGGGIHFVSPNFEDLNLNIEAKTAKIIAQKHPFIPIHIYKILTKIGCCWIKENDINLFEDTFSFLVKNNDDDKFKGNGIMSMQLFFIPGPTLVEHPVSILFRRKVMTSKLPGKIIVLHYKNLVIQSIIPFNKEDNHLIGSQVQMPIYPIMLENQWFEKFGKYQYYNIDLSSNEKICNEDASVGIQFLDLIEKSS